MRLALPVIVAALAASSTFADTPAAETTLTMYPQFMAGDFFARNWMKTVPHGTQLSKEKPASITKEPEYKGAPLYGTVKFGDAANWTGGTIVLDDEADKVYIDANGDGDLTNDTKVAWNKVNKPEGDRPASYDGAFTFPAKWTTGPGKYGVKMYRPKGSDRVFWQTVGAPTGVIKIDGQSYVVFLYDQIGEGNYSVKPGNKSAGAVAFIDTDGDGTWRPIEHREVVSLGAPIQLGEKWYSFDASADGTSLKAYPAEAPPKVETTPMVKVGDDAKDFLLIMPDGKTTKLSDRKGKIVLLDFWATWCGPCLAAMPKVEALHQKLKDQPNVEVIGLCVMDEKEKFDAWIPKNNTKYTFTFARDGSLSDGNGTAAARAYGLSAIPTTVVIAPDGKVTEVVSGFTEANEAKVVEAMKKLGAKLD